MLSMIHKHHLSEASTESIDIHFGLSLYRKSLIFEKTRRRQIKEKQWAIKNTLCTPNQHDISSQNRV